MKKLVLILTLLIPLKIYAQAGHAEGGSYVSTAFGVLGTTGLTCSGCNIGVIPVSSGAGAFQDSLFTDDGTNGAYGGTNFSIGALYITGGGGAGFINLPTQNIAPSGVGTGSMLYASGGNTRFLNDSSGGIISLVNNVTGGEIVSLTVSGSAAAQLFSTLTGAFSAPTLQLISSSPPSCDASHRGQFQYAAGATLVADVVQVCAKASTDVYSWYPIATIP